MASRKRPRVIIEVSDEEEEQPDDSGTNPSRGPDPMPNVSASGLRAQTKATCLPPAMGPHSPLVPDLSASPGEGEDSTKTRYLLRASGAPYQLWQLDDGDTQSVDDGTESEHIRKRRRLNNETKSSGLKSSQPQPRTQTKRPPTQPLVAKKSINTANGSTKHPTRISLSKFPSIIKPDDYPPPLPPICDKMLERQCFTHRSYTTTMTDYERLEWLGDTFLNYCVARILYARLPESQEGPLTVLRDHLICNDNIRHYAAMYGFPGKMLLGKQAEHCGNPEKAVADTFEAYIGGLLTDQPETGEKVVFEWISKVTEPQMEEIAKLRPSCNKKAKYVLEGLLAAEKIAAPSYVHLRGSTEDGDIEYACLVQGRELVQGSWRTTENGQWKEIGRGSGKSAREAKVRAAMQVLERLKGAEPRKKFIVVENEAGEFVEIPADPQVLD